MYKYTNAFTNRSGDSLPGYFARLYDSDGNQVDIFADANGTPISTVSGVANAALSDENGMFRWFVANGTYDIRFYDSNDVFVAPAEIGVPMVDAGALTIDLSAETGATLVGTPTGTVQTDIDARPTTAALASPTGGGMVGFKQVGADAVDRNIQAELSRSLTAEQFGAVGDGATDDTAAVIAAQTALAAQGGGTLFFTRGKTYEVTDIPMVPGVTYSGSGRSDINQTAKPGAKLQSSTGNIFINTGATISAVQFEDLWIESLTGGGHIFDWSAAGLVAKVEGSGLTLVQNNIGKSIINGTSAGGVFSIWFHDFDYQFADGNTVPAFLFQSPTVNSIVLERFWSTPATAALASTYSIVFESTNVGGAAINCFVRDAVFEHPRGGCVKMLSCVNSAVEDSAVYDLLVAPDNEQFVIAKGAVGPASAHCWLKGVRSTIGTTGKPDLKIDTSVSGQGAIIVDSCSFAYVDGGGATPVINFRACDIQNFQNIAYTNMGGAPGLDLVFGTTDGSSRAYAFWNGYSGNGPGFLNIDQNGVLVGCISPSGLFQWGGTRGVPKFYITQQGEQYMRGALYPATPALSDQATAGIFGGAGAPNNADGADGNFYLRSDGGSLTTVYQKRAGSWVGIV